MELVGKGEVLWSETRGNRSHLLLSGQPSPSTASSSKVLRVVTSDFQNYLNYLNIILRKQNLLTFTYLKKESLDLFDLSDSALFEVNQPVRTGQNCLDIFHYK